MQLENNWRRKSLEILENHRWGNSIKAPTNLVKRCIELTKVPVEDFTVSDLGIMIGQKFGLRFFIPIAIDKLQNDIFIEADFYKEDLISGILDIDASFWNKNKNQWKRLNDLLTGKR